MQYPLKSLFNNWMGTEKKKVTVLIDYLITLNQPTYYLNMPTQISFLILHKTPDVDILLGIRYNIKQFCIAQGLTEDRADEGWWGSRGQNDRAPASV